MQFMLQQHKNYTMWPGLVKVKCCILAPAPACTLTDLQLQCTDLKYHDLYYQNDYLIIKSVGYDITVFYLSSLSHLAT